MGCKWGVLSMYQKLLGLYLLATIMMATLESFSIG